MNKRIVLVLVLVAFVCGMLFTHMVKSETQAIDATPAPKEEVIVTSTAKVTATPTAKVTATPTAKVTATSTAMVTATPTAMVTATPTAMVTATLTPYVTVSPTSVAEKKKNGPVTVQDLFGTGKVKTYKDFKKEVAEDNNSKAVYEETVKKEENVLTVQDLFGKGKKVEIKNTPVPSPKVTVYTEIVVKESPMPTLNPVNLGAENKILENGFQLCSVLLNKDGNIIAIENQYELKTRKQTLTSLQTGNSKIIKVVSPVENCEDDRLNGRFVRSKKPHEVLVKDGQITAGYSLVPLKLEVVDAKLLEELIGKKANEVTAQDIVASTVVAEDHDGRWIAAHKSAPGFRGPLVAKLYLEDGRWLRVEKWNWTINEGDPKSIGVPSLVFVMCSDRGARTPV